MDSIKSGLSKVMTKRTRTRPLSAYLPSKYLTSHSAYERSIIAIHGLDTESPRTWAAYETEGDKTSRLVHWLQDEDMLPRVIPNARIFTYDWNANTFSNAAVEDIFGHAKTLLLKIDQERGQVTAVLNTLLLALLI